ncbi:DinB family protein [uncultured Arcticibacterium sp.]|uniref:DinB family protein n=1 Tax=uncultured Arcticibacterium sp. TaxID=2173042 RepID=UPI0030FCEC5F
MKDKLIESFKSYIESLDSYSDEEFAFKYSPDIWSLAQMYEHLQVTGFVFFLANINRCLEHRKGQLGGTPSESGNFVLKNNGFPLKQKFKRPDAEINPVITGQSIAHYKEGFKKLQGALLATIEAVEQDAGEYRTNHFYFGMLNAKEWLLNTEFHLRHHLTQKEELESYLR